MTAETRFILVVCLLIVTNAISVVVTASHERDVCRADEAKKKDTAQAQVNARDVAASDITYSAQTWLWANLPPIDLRTHDDREHVRIMYRERDAAPAADPCAAAARPVGVQSTLEQARDRANAARGEVRAIPNAIPAAGPRVHVPDRVAVPAHDG